MHHDFSDAPGGAQWTQYRGRRTATAIVHNVDHDLIRLSFWIRKRDDPNAPLAFDDALRRATPEMLTRGILPGGLTLNCSWRRRGRELHDRQCVDLREARRAASPPRGALIYALLVALGRRDVDAREGEVLQRVLHGAAITVDVRLVEAFAYVVDVPIVDGVRSSAMRRQYVPTIIDFLPLIQ